MDTLGPAIFGIILLLDRFYSLRDKIVLPWEPQNLSSTAAENVISYNYSECPASREVHYMSCIAIRVPIRYCSGKQTDLYLDLRMILVLQYVLTVEQAFPFVAVVFSQDEYLISYKILLCSTFRRRFDCS